LFDNLLDSDDLSFFEIDNFLWGFCSFTLLTRWFLPIHLEDNMHVHVTFGGTE